MQFIGSSKIACERFGNIRVTANNTKQGNETTRSQDYSPESFTPVSSPLFLIELSPTGSALARTD